MEAIAAKNISYTYQGKYQKVQALKGVSCNFEAGKFYAIIGKSGSGKSTLLSMLAGMASPTEGEVLVYNEPLETINNERHRRENVSVIYQDFNLFPTLTILENVSYPMEIAKKSRKESIEKAKELLRSVGFQDDQFKKLPAMLSGGEQQRVAIARALGSDAKIILGDEPTGNLDTENSQMVIDILVELVRKENYCVIIVTHDLAIASQADKVYKMKDGKLEK